MCIRDSLLQHGRTRVAMVAGPKGRHNARERIRGWRLALRQAGLDEGVVINGPFKMCIRDRPHTVHYEHATAACNPEPSRELLQKFPSQRAITLASRRIRAVALRRHPGKTVGNLGINCAGTHYCVSPARTSGTAYRWHLSASAPWRARLDLKPKR